MRSMSNHQRLISYSYCKTRSIWLSFALFFHTLLMNPFRKFWVAFQVDRNVFCTAFAIDDVSAGFRLHRHRLILPDENLWVGKFWNAMVYSLNAVCCLWWNPQTTENALEGGQTSLNVDYWEFHVTTGSSLISCQWITGHFKWSICLIIRCAIHTIETRVDCRSLSSC